MSDRNLSRPVDVLLVEDNPGDVRLTREALKEGRSGREVLSEVKRDPALRQIPVVVLTSSQAEEDVLRAYDLHANCYITKPVDLDQFIRVVQSIEDFWFTVVKLPPE